MAATDATAILSQLKAPSQADRVAALRHLKNSVIGHPQRKSRWVQQGLLPPLIQLIASDIPEPISDATYRGRITTLDSTAPDAEAATLHALQLLASIVGSNPRILAPLHASRAIPAILNSSCLSVDRPEIALAALRVLRDTTALARHASPPCLLNTSYLAELILSDHQSGSLSQLLLQPTPDRRTDAQVSIIAYLVKTLCRDEPCRNALATNGILDALATRLAGYVVSQGQVLPGAELLAQQEGLADYIPLPATQACDIGNILGAIAAIITDSPFRACKFLFSPSILAVFPNTGSEQNTYSKTSAEPLELPGIRPTRHTGYEPMGFLLPRIPWPNTAPANGAFGEVHYPQSYATSASVPRPWAINPTNNDSSAAGDMEPDEAESPMIPWLIYLIRVRQGSEMVMAASVLTSLAKAGLALAEREHILSLVVVPILLNLVAELEATAKANELASDDRESSNLDLLEEIPAVLARLATDSEVLQKAAFDASAVNTLCRLLKHTYDTPLPPLAPQPWSPTEHGDAQPSDAPAECTLGGSEDRRVVNHRMSLRASTLRAIGALGTFKEEHRKAIVAQGVSSYIVECLSTSPEHPGHAKEEGKGDGWSNGISDIGSQYAVDLKPIIIAGCFTVRTLSRSISVLRTALIDHGASTPLYNLLRHRDLDIQNAAGAAICNMVVDFSPMREPLVTAGVTEVLCKHARSQDATLRINALWALKHLVHLASIDQKKQVLDLLGPGWLVQLICENTEDENLHNSRFKDEMDEDTDMSQTEDQIRSWPAISPVKPCPSGLHWDKGLLALADARLASLRDAESNPTRKARQDDLIIQEQGLAFIRNLITLSSNSTNSVHGCPDMINQLLASLGHDRLFGILASKLRARVQHPFSRRDASHHEARVYPPHTKTIVEVIYILVHMGGSIPEHRQLVIAQTELLKSLAKLCNSPHREVRVALCHLINNLTWLDEGSDDRACSQRATELRKLGFLQKLEKFSQTDDEAEVRERAKSALWQMKAGI